MNFGLEDETLEFKKSTGEINEAMNSICAMLNKHGRGTLYFGVLRNGEPCGQIVSESTLRDISRKVYETITPQVIPVINKRIADEREIIEVTFRGNDKPYSCKGVYYIRVSDEDRVLEPNELRQLFEYNKNQSWDSELTEYTIDDISFKSLEKFYNKAILCGRLKEEKFDPEKILLKLGLMKNNKLTNAAYYLFSNKCPIVLKMAIFATDEKLTFLDINRINGNIIDLIEEANEYVKRNIRWKADIVGMKRVEIPEVPLKALREIVCNSFAHARYNSNTEHEITIHPSMIRIYNPGEFPIGLTPEDFINTNTPWVIRNPLILKTLFLSDDVESYSSGFKRVYDECGKNNVKIEYELKREGFCFIFNRYVINDVINDVINVTLTHDEKMVVNLILSNSNITIENISEVINKKPRTVQRILNSLREKKMIERIGGTRGYWKVINDIN